MMAKESILIVEDEPGCREALTLILQNTYEVSMAADGREALKIMKNKYFDLITLDLHMPGLSGFDILPEIRKLAPGTEVIIISGYGTLANAGKALHSGINDFISKPFVVSEILSTVETALAHKKMRQRIAEVIRQGEASQIEYKKMRYPGEPDQ
jgi:DNA-binding NtrC family response regulator